MPGEPTTNRFDDPLPPAPDTPVRPPSDSPENIIDQNNDDTSGNVAAQNVPDDANE